MQEIDESIGFIAKVTDAKVARKRSGMKKNATNSRIFHARIIGTLAVVSKRPIDSVTRPQRCRGRETGGNMAADYPDEQRLETKS